MTQYKGINVVLIKQEAQINHRRSQGGPNGPAPPPIGMSEMINL